MQSKHGENFNYKELEPDPQVKPGMTARVSIVTEKVENALTVPSAALSLMGEDEAIVQVVTSRNAAGVPTFEERTVTVVLDDSTTAIVKGDLADGD